MTLSRESIRPGTVNRMKPSIESPDSNQDAIRQIARLLVEQAEESMNGAQ